MAWRVRLLILGLVWIGAAVQLGSAEIPKAPVPKSPYIATVYRYADTMLKNGRDRNGLFWSALDRNTLAPLTNRPAAPQGVREQDRVGAKDVPLAGSNPYHDENLLRLLSMLTDLTAKPHYRAAADAELKWLLEHDALRAAESFRPWVLWDRCFELSPEASKQFIQRVSTLDVTTGTPALQRAAGFRVRALAVGYSHTKDEQLLRVILRWCDRYETNAFVANAPSFMIDCDGAAHYLPELAASRLRKVAAHQDMLFCRIQEDVKKNGGFVLGTRQKLQVTPVSRPVTSLWKASHDGRTTAQIGMMCVSRYDNSGDVRYRNLIFGAADLYLDSLPNNNEDVWPMTFGHAINLQLAAWRHSADWKYMERARKFGDLAMEKFWGTNALPKASFKTDHYETITGADTLALALVELHLNVLHITAVRCPPNTIDR